MKKALIVFYSFSGITRRFAEQIANLIDADARELIPENNYSFDYNTAAKEARNNVKDGIYPKLKSGDEPVDSYDYIFIGSPNWFHT